MNPDAPPQVGDQWRVDFGENHFANKLLHVRAVVDDDYIVVRHWKRGRWVYEMDFIWGYEGSEHYKLVSRAI